MKFTNNLVLFLLFLIATGASFFLTTKIRSQTAVVTVIVSDSGFSPNEITISKGTSIKWLVKGKGRYWPASNAHPTHEDYPERGGCIGSKLDACRVLNFNEYFLFKFDKEGLFELHDHLHPGFVMSVNVTGDNKKRVGVSPQTLRKNSEAQQKKVLIEMARNDPAKAWNLLKKTFIVDDQTVGNAHGYAHVIGNEIYNKFGLKGMGICDDEFAFGCYHGVSEKMLLALGKDSLKMIEAECVKNWPPNVSQNFTGCIHGAGHGLVAWRGLELDKALLDCGVLAQGNRDYCHNGVMMEYMESAPNSMFDKADPWKFCLKLEGEFQRLCGQYQIVIYTTKFKYTFIQAANVCAQAPNIILRDTCFHGLGSRTAQQAQGNFDKISNECLRIENLSDRSTCILYAADQVVFQEYKDWGNISIKLCDMLDDVGEKKCLAQRNFTVNLYRKKLPKSVTNI